MTEQLKPCPFCGGKDLKFYFSKGRGDLHEYAFTGICCQNKDCGVVVQLHLLDADEWTEKSAYEFCSEIWNRRADNESTND